MFRFTLRNGWAMSAKGSSHSGGKGIGRPGTGGPDYLPRWALRFARSGSASAAVHGDRSDILPWWKARRETVRRRGTC